MVCREGRGRGANGGEEGGAGGEEGLETLLEDKNIGNLNCTKLCTFYFNLI